jgi:hypothetical protein
MSRLSWLRRTGPASRAQRIWTVHFPFNISLCAELDPSTLYRRQPSDVSSAGRLIHVLLLHSLDRCHSGGRDAENMAMR